MFSSHSCWHRTCDKRVLCQRLRTGCCAVSPHLLLNTGSGKKKKPSSHHPPALSDKYSHLALVYDIQHDVQVFLKAVLVLIPSRFTPEWYKKKNIQQNYLWLNFLFAWWNSANSRVRVELQELSPNTQTPFAKHFLSWEDLEAEAALCSMLLWFGTRTGASAGLHSPNSVFT